MKILTSVLKSVLVQNIENLQILTLSLNLVQNIENIYIYIILISKQHE